MSRPNDSRVSERHAPDVAAPAAGLADGEAVLLIHVCQVAGAPGVRRWLQQLRAACLLAAPPAAESGISLTVKGLQCGCIKIIEPVGELHRLTLPAGPCLVTARLGPARRDYYLCLAPDSQFDLYLELGL